ncbi:MAG: aspartyl protease family protein [Verrucomicrobiota bacterium]
MGITYAPIKLKNPAEPDTELDVTAMADSGAATLCIPETVARDLKLTVNGNTREVTLADGRHLEVPYVGPVEVWFEGRHCYVGALVLGDEVLLGAIPMEDMDLVVTPNRRDVSVNPESPEIPTLKVK